ncbi:hypothetical protein DFA_10143 [Cavenderia fasciculata]|uniref:Small EDRK-rich factor-like N-terminal domain-containing protein n=1 Tax=Cavenderia fasciculata TaxID=261658 RepID=F4Q9E0_CACFS|nr:uncharacterized protein DFA_10143 [Cavenderia fasciculata]EGG15309.1 hypothetical protein DFA_10143 [Cavenderia fasciculata]|eukprot:XP_004352029.1 hypothetical protein DFA_10143 [Cavenderia fasciculata]
MTRGNQREIDRKRAEARKAQGPQGKQEDFNVRKERDNKALLDKQKAFNDKKQAEEEAALAAKRAAAAKK